MPINNITQTISELPAAGRRGVDVQTLFVTKQEDFQDHLQGTTVVELNALVTQQNTMAEEMNSTATQVNTNANTATTKAGEANTSASSASTSASQALTSRNQAETFAQQAQASALSVDVNNLVHRTGAETIAGVKTFSSNIVGNITGNAQTATSLLGDETNWASYRSRSVANTLGWKNYGNGHCIFDASAGIAPNGVAVSNTYVDAPWAPARPTLMGWNGSGTFGVRVDSSRYADQLKTPVTINGVAFDGSTNITVDDSTAVKLTAFTGANASFGSNGYQKLPSGLIIQWGVTTEAGSTVDYRTFPISFPTYCLNISTTMNILVNIPVWAKIISNSQFQVGIGADYTNGGGTQFWFAIGY